MLIGFCSSDLLLVMLRISVMLLQQVDAKITVEVSPDGVDVVGIILGVVVLDDERRAQYSVAMPLAAVQPSQPGKADLVESPPRVGAQCAAGPRPPAGPPRTPR